MKKLLFVSLSTVTILLTSLVVLAQGEPGTEPPVDLWAYILSPAAMIATAVLITGAVAKSLIKLYKQIICGAVSIGLVWAGSYFNQGWAADFTGIWIVLWGIGIGAAANGIVSWGWVVAILEAIKLKTPHKK